MKKVCFVGASTTEGMGDIELLGWVGRLRKVWREQAVCFNLGVRGQTLQQIADRAVCECAARLPTDVSGIIILSPGINDLAVLDDGSSRSKLTETLEIFETLITELSNVGNVSIVGPGPVDENKMPFYSLAAGQNLSFLNKRIFDADRAYSTCCAERSIRYYSVISELIKSEAYIRSLSYSDGIHPDADGYNAQFDFLMNSDIQTLLQS